MKQFTIPMALLDFIPVILYAATAIILQRCLYNKMSKGTFALFATGTIDVVIAGSLKALYKLLYAAGICDFESLSSMHFPVQAIGFLLAGIAIIAMFNFNQGTTVFSVAPVLYKGTFIFVGMMIAGVACINTGLAILAKKLKKPSAIICFALSFIFMLCMGYLSSKDFNQAFMNYVAETVNIIGQGLLLLGTVILKKAGLAELDISKK